MTTKTIIIALVSTLAGAAVAAGYHWIGTAGACGGGGGGAAEGPAAAPSSDSCSLDPSARRDAIAELAVFSRKHLSTAKASVTASFHGDHAELRRFLEPAIAREAACCSFLELKLVRTERGYDVVMGSDRGGLAELAAALGALAP